MTCSKCVKYVFLQKKITATFKLQNIYNVGCKLSVRYWMWNLILPQPTTFPYPLDLTHSASVHSTNAACSLDNSTVCGTVWWADGRPLLYVVLWLWLSAVLHSSWMVIRLTALQWMEGWTKPPPEPTYSREHVKFWGLQNWCSTVFRTQQDTVATVQQHTVIGWLCSSLFHNHSS